MKNSDFQHKLASEIDTDLKYDIVTSHSVFHYFESLEYAYEVVKKMILKSNKIVGIFDINDKFKESLYHKIRMGKMEHKYYVNKYKDLDHQFYEKNWFENIAKKYNLKINIYDQTFKNYSNSPLRFNVILFK